MLESIVCLRDRRQITLPADVVAAVGLALNDTLQVSVSRGAIVLTPTRATPNPPASMARFLGAAQAVFGTTAEQGDAIVRDARDAW